MNFEKPSLYQNYVNRGDVRVLYQLITEFSYTVEEVSEVINCYELNYSFQIPEVEHIETIVTYYPNKINISGFTLKSIANSFPERLEYIIKLNNKKKI
jgi:hypothetical protein